MNEFEFLGDLLLVISSKISDTANDNDFVPATKKELHRLSNIVTDVVFELNRIDYELEEHAKFVDNLKKGGSE